MTERSVLSPRPGPTSPPTRLMLIGGEWVEAADGEWREVTSPAHRGSVLAHVPRRHRGAVISAARSAGRWVTLDAAGLHDAWNRPPVLRPGGFALALDGDVLASVDPLGAWVAWHPESKQRAQ